MTTDFAKELQAAAEMTQALVRGLRWLEREGPTEGRLASVRQDLVRLIRDFDAVLDKTNTRTHGNEKEKLQGLGQILAGLITRLIETSRDVHLRVHVLYALEQMDPETRADGGER